MNKTLQNDISFSLQVQMVQAKMNLYLSLPVYSLISTKYKIRKNNNNYCALHTDISTRK